MKIAVYSNSTNSEALRAFVSGVERLGCELVWRRQQVKDLINSDAACLFGLKQVNRELKETLNARGIPVIVMEWGHLLRSRGYHQVNVNRLCWLPPGPCPSDRFEMLGLDRATERREGDYVLVCGQTPGDAQHNMGWGAILRWQGNLLKEIKRNTGREVVWRSHPNMFRSLVQGEILRPSEADRVSDPKLHTLAEDIEGAHALVTYNSTSGQEALLMGVPVFCNPCAIYAGVANTDLARLEDPGFFDTEDYFNRLAYSQWTFAEIAEGKALEFLLPYLEVPSDRDRSDTEATC